MTKYWKIASFLKLFYAAEANASNGAASYDPIQSNSSSTL
jgi:hypothetical protein